MKLIHRYILRLFVRNFLAFLAIATFLFLIIDFFDRIDNILEEDASIGLIFGYFFYKIPELASLVTPIAMLVAVLFSIGTLARNFEITAMRASGMTIYWLARPVFMVGIVVSIITLIAHETLIPFCSRRSDEIYNIDIKKKHESGTYSVKDVWWRSGSDFYSISNFDSRTSTLLDLSRFRFSPEFEVTERIDAKKVGWVDNILKWSMYGVEEYTFAPDRTVQRRTLDRLALPINEQPKDFYRVRVDPDTMGYIDLNQYIKRLSTDGLSTKGYEADLAAKLAYPFVSFILVLIALPFSLKPARSGNLAVSFVAGLTIGFLYFVVHSFSVSLGRAELISPLIAAWMANLLLGFVGIVLNWGAEAP